MNGECGESLSCTLGKPNVRQRGLFSNRKDVLDAVRNVMESELINRKVPEFRGRRGDFRALFRVFVPPIVAQPDVISFLNELERETTLLLGQTHPYLAVHKQAMVKIDYFLPDAVIAGVDQQTLLAFPIRKAVQTEQVSIRRLDNMLLCFVAEEGAKISKV
jgi:hypothetical protein